MDLEICIDSYDSLISAAVAGADRVEICADLGADGLTPSVGLVRLACQYEDLEKFVMIRPRPGHFTYDGLELIQMKESIMAFKEMDIDGFVFGVLDEEGRVDIEAMKELCYLAYPKPVCFHRAFDFSVDGEEKIDELFKMGVVRILTSGKKPTAPEGVDTLKELYEKYGQKLEIMAGSGVNFENIEEIYKKTGIKSYHMSAKSVYQTEIDYDNFGEKFPDYQSSSSGLVEAARQVLDKLED